MHGKSLCALASPADLQPSQIYLSAQKLEDVEAWMSSLTPDDIAPLPIHDFGDGRLTLTDGHSRAFVCWRLGFEKVPVCWDTTPSLHASLTRSMYRACIAWCQQRRIHRTQDLAAYIVPPECYRSLWIDRCKKLETLLCAQMCGAIDVRLLEEKRQRLKERSIHVYGITSDLRTLCCEDKDGAPVSFPLHVPPSASRR